MARLNFWIYPGDCAQILRFWPSNSFDSMVTDPPAGVGFMNAEWDSDKGGRDEWVAWLASAMSEALRVLKPGGYGLVWALPRTSHWTAWALESAGFLIRDRVSHLFGTGFPKSSNFAPELGTALKPACEDWWLIQKPREGTFPANMAKWGTGGLRISDCMLGRDETQNSAPRANARAVGNTNFAVAAGPRGGGKDGRWPSNVVLDDEAAVLLNQQTGTLKRAGAIGAHTAAAAAARTAHVAFSSHKAPRGEWVPHGDKGGASRFFYCSKPSKAEREFGCDGLPLVTAGEATGGRAEGSAGLKSPRAGAGRTGGSRNHHPTLKSIRLMTYLCRLVTPKGGLVLDPFMGSGTTGIAALREGLRFVGIEQELKYLTIACARLHAHQGVINEEVQTAESADASDDAVTDGSSSIH
jgi:hypothetical protein